MTNRNQQMQDRARALIPGMTQLLSKRPDQFAPGQWPSYYSHAKGCRITDLDGREWLDMSIGGIGATILGYADDAIDDAVRAAIGGGVASSLNCPEEVELAQTLVDLHPWSDQARFTRSGGEAMALAVRLARVHTRREMVAVCGYHGWHDWYLAANLGADDSLDGHLLPGLSPEGVPRGLAGSVRTFRYNHLDQLAAIVEDSGSRLAAVVMEPQRGQQPQPGFLAGVRELASRAGAVLIFDEISSGFRQVTGGLHLRFAVDPDMAVFSKAMGNGYAIAAVLGRASVMSAAQSTFVSSTMWTERVGPAAALATIAAHATRKVGPHLEYIGQRVQDGWQAAADAAGLSIHIDGSGPISHYGLDLGPPGVVKALVVQELLRHGILGSVVFYAMAAHADAEVDQYVQAMHQVFTDLAQWQRQGDIAAHLQGPPAACGFARLT